MKIYADLLISSILEIFLTKTKSIEILVATLWAWCTQSSRVKKLLLIVDLCQGLVETRKSIIYPLIDRLIWLILTLLGSMITTKRAFLVIKIVKTRLRIQMDDDFLADYLIVYIEKDIAKIVLIDIIINNLYYIKKWRAQLK